MFPRLTIEAVANSKMDVGDAVDALLGAIDWEDYDVQEAIVQHPASAGVDRAPDVRYPFKRSKSFAGHPSRFIGPGPRGRVHYQASEDYRWKCRRLGMYDYECQRVNPKTGRLQTKRIRQSPTKKSQYNAEYKAFRRKIRKGLVTIPDNVDPRRFPAVRFKSQKLSAADDTWLIAAYEKPGRIQRAGTRRPRKLAAGEEVRANLVESVRGMIRMGVLTNVV